MQFDVWLDAQLAECGVQNRRVADHVKSFDRLAAHFAVLADDAYWIERTAQAAETRLRYLIRRHLAALSDLLGEPVTWDYCRAIYAQMSFPRSIEEAPAAWLRMVFQALDTRVRKLSRVAA